MAVDDVDLSDGRLEIAHIRGERGFELLGGDFEISLGQNAFEFAQHQRVRREDADSQFRGCSFRSHCCQTIENCPNGQVPWKRLFSNCY